MILKALYRNMNHFLLLNVSEFLSLTMSFVRKDVDMFLQRYPILAMEPLDALRHVFMVIRKTAAYTKAKVPEFVPIAFKLAFAFSLIITLGLISLGSLIGLNQTNLLENQATHFGIVLAEQAAQSIKEPLLADDTLGIKSIIKKLTEEESIVGSSVYTDEQHPIASTGFRSANITFPKNGKRYSQSKDTFGVFHIVESNYRPVISFTVPITHGQLIVGYTSLSFDHSMLEMAKTNTIYAVVTITLLTLITGIIGSYYMSKRITKPLNELMKATRAITQGSFDYQFSDDRRSDELGILMEAMNNMGTDLLRKEKVESVFSRYVSPQVATQALKDLDELDTVELGGQHVMASVFFADIVNFTSLSENLEPQKVSELLNFYFSKIADAVLFCGGHIDKFMGDCAMVLFGVPNKNEQHAFRNIACAWMILRLVEALNEKRKAANELTVEFRIGANTGMMLAGNMGSHDRMDYTVVGDEVNFASRLSHIGDPGEIIIANDMFNEQKLSDKILTESKATVQLRGKKMPVSALSVLDLSTPFKAEILNEILLMTETYK